MLLDTSKFTRNVIVKDNCWTEWFHAYGEINCEYFTFRTNGKKVQVRREGYKGEASCNKIDKFDLGIGIQIAYARSCIKKLEDEIFFIYQSLNFKESQIKEHEYEIIDTICGVKLKKINH